MRKIEDQIFEIDEKLKVFWVVIKNSTLFAAGLLVWIMIIPNIIELMRASIFYQILAFFFICLFLNALYLIIKKIKLLIILYQESKQKRKVK